LSARPYAFLDDAPIEERRTQAVQNRRYGDPESADANGLGQLDADAIASVRDEAWPRARNADEMHEALVALGVVADGEAVMNEGWTTWLGELAAAARATRLDVRDAIGGNLGLWVAAERLAQVRGLYPDAALQPAIEAPAECAKCVATRDEALREVLRARLGGLGPAAAAPLAARLGLARGDVELGLLALQAEGYVLQGRFTPLLPAAADAEWCERHLLARIHRYTLKRLRREIEPVEPRDFARFLFDWQRVGATSRVSGPDALAGVLGQLEGFEAPAAVWEAEILPARVQDYASPWLDDLCTAGRTLWTRLRPVLGDGRAAGTSLRSTPVLLLPRRAAALWTRIAPARADDADLGSRARLVVQHLLAHGASFFDEIADAVRLLPAELEDVLAELVVRGRVNCDSFAGLRALLVPAAKRAPTHARRRRGVTLLGIADAGRWSLIRSAPAASDVPARKPDGDALEHVARILLRRYGVVCWRLLEREAAWLPPWRELVRVYRRLEARGEIRGGRFIAGLTGEQFALPEAIASMREVRRRPGDDALVCLAASDPANLLGTVVPGPKVARVAGARVVWRDGVPLAMSVGGEIELLLPATAGEARAIEAALRQGPTWTSLARSAAAAPA
jgi:ATP-dependent Lhr-like helicase